MWWKRRTYSSPSYSIMLCSITFSNFFIVKQKFEIVFEKVTFHSLLYKKILVSARKNHKFSEQSCNQRLFSSFTNDFFFEHKYFTKRTSVVKAFSHSNFYTHF